MQDARAAGGRFLMADLDWRASNDANLGLLTKLGLVACDADDLTVSPDSAGLLRFDRVGTSQLDPWLNKKIPKTFATPTTRCFARMGRVQFARRRNALKQPI